MISEIVFGDILMKLMISEILISDIFKYNFV